MNHSNNLRKVVLPTLCVNEHCTACSACYNICSQNAISMEENKYGELYPIIDTSKCIGCKKCERVCPELSSSSIYHYRKPIIYDCWLKQAKDRRESTSGGAAYAISCAIIRKGGHVWGATYDKELIVHYTEANSLQELRPIQKSKYVQCCVGECFKRIKQELENEELVLFCGTGCHVKGLRSFLQKDYTNLYTMDLICHGVPGQGVFRKYKEWLEKKYGDKLINYIPRHKRADGQEIGYYTMATFQHKGDVKMELKENGYFIGFQHNLFLRTACHHCTANGEERYADFTVGDFWGLGKIKPFRENKQRPLGISMLALNSDKAKAFFREYSDDIIYEERSFEEASISNTQYYKPAIPSPRRDEFRKEWDKLTWEELTDKYLRYTTKELILYGIKKFTPPICYCMLNHWRNGSNKKRFKRRKGL